MAKPDKKSIDPSTDASGGKSHTALYVIGAVAIAAIIAGVYFMRDSGPANPNGPKEDPAVAVLMEEGPLEDIVMGDPGAPNVIVEYASMTCPHCANFYTNVFPEVKEKYIDTGRAKFVVR